MTTAPAAGTMLGRYQVLKPLARGGMAEVLLARAIGLKGFERHVVIKRIRVENGSDQKSIDMFLDEARLAGSLHHRNIVQVHDVGEEEGKYFFVMEYVHGRDARELLRMVKERKAQIPLEHVITIATAAAAGLHYAHEQRGLDRLPLGIVHRDVSPGNILLAFDGGVKVVDFGIAKAHVRSADTQAGEMKGKVGYMSPEQCKAEPIDRRTDIFLLGIVLYELATVRRLFKYDTRFETMSAIVDREIVPPSRYRKDLPAELEQIIMKALAKSPTDRYRTADELRVALESFATRAALTLSASRLSDYLKELYGDVPEPWLVDERLPPPDPELLKRASQPSLVTVAASSVTGPLEKVAAASSTESAVATSSTEPSVSASSTKPSDAASSTQPPVAESNAETSAAAPSTGFPGAASTTVPPVAASNTRVPGATPGMEPMSAASSTEASNAVSNTTALGAAPGTEPIGAAQSTESTGAASSTESSIAVSNTTALDAAPSSQPPVAASSTQPPVASPSTQPTGTAPSSKAPVAAAPTPASPRASQSTSMSWPVDPRSMRRRRAWLIALGILAAGGLAFLATAFLGSTDPSVAGPPAAASPEPVSPTDRAGSPQLADPSPAIEPSAADNATAAHTAVDPTGANVAGVPDAGVAESVAPVTDATNAAPQPVETAVTPAHDKRVGTPPKRPRRPARRRVPAASTKPAPPAQPTESAPPAQQTEPAPPAQPTEGAPAPTPASDGTPAAPPADVRATPTDDGPPAPPVEATPTTSQ